MNTPAYSVDPLFSNLPRPRIPEHLELTTPGDCFTIEKSYQPKENPVP